MQVLLAKGECVSMYAFTNSLIEVEKVTGNPMVDIFILEYDYSVTFTKLKRLELSEGDYIYSANGEPLAIILKTTGKINILFPGCLKETYNNKILGCRDLASLCLNIERKVLPSSINLFMNYEIYNKDHLKVVVKKPISSTKEKVIIKALSDIHVAIVVCPSSLSVDSSLIRISVKS